MTTPQVPLVSTSQLQPDGVAGYLKAIGAFFSPVIALVIESYADGSITSAEWRNIALAGVTAAFATWLLPNRIKPTPPAQIEPINEV